MITQIVKDYDMVVDIPDENNYFTGQSASEKRIIFSLFDNQRNVNVLDIGFGVGDLGKLIKLNPETSHWSVDGIDGFEITCKNKELFEKKIYRNVYHGYAQELTKEQLEQYDVLCLLDVIEHLDVDMAKKLLVDLLSSLRDGAYLLISTPLWFYPQDTQREGDLEEHKIGVPATSMMGLQPIMYAMGPVLVGSFVYKKNSLAFVDYFQPTTDKSFSIQRGIALAEQIGMKLDMGVVYRVG